MTHDERVHELLYSCEDREELAERIARLERENAELRELVRSMWHDGMCECGERSDCETCEYGYLDRMRELGIEVD